MGHAGDRPPTRIVVADDTADMRLLLRSALELDTRFEVIGEAADGVEAVRLAASLAPDALILDLSMPTLDGLEAIPEIRRQAPGARIVVLSGFDSRAKAAEALERGADAYLDKTRAIDELPHLLGRLCRDD